MGPGRVSEALSLFHSECLRRLPRTQVHSLIAPPLHHVPEIHEGEQHKPHRTLHDPLGEREHASTTAFANKLKSSEMKMVRFIADAADGYITVNIMEAITYQVLTPKPIQGEIDTDAGDNIEITKSWETHISKKVSGNTKDDYVAVLKSAVGSLKIDKKRLKKLQESIGESMCV